ncbi:MAG: hypothetical protein EB165_02705 [Euryarchaeota archaeon]|nr:hypothetical protein [Euryarchaeota archaeon]NDB93540.1 hypothetical protein [Euryarchaeota archaeon]
MRNNAKSFTDDELRDQLIHLVEEANSRSSMLPELGQLLLGLAFESIGTASPQKEEQPLDLLSPLAVPRAEACAA